MNLNKMINLVNKCNNKKKFNCIWLNLKDQNKVNKIVI